MPQPKSLRVTQLELTNSEGVERAGLTAGDDYDGQRIAPAAGLIIRDRDGRERGGLGVLDTDDGSRVVCALDHPGGDAIGMMVEDNGCAGFFLNDDHGEGRQSGATRLSMTITSEGTPAFALLYEDEKPRLRFTLTEQGAGAIQFLDSEGEIVQQIAPEEA